ncbi:Asp-tRNA(Asn)/Glu-tRNA(Gln) amidotransferase subunit GatC [Wandonia haliotis]|uniref:Aspartyl/glutamyl-tRNA(Asn/Gln) amidotransferase subunit C n=1 Tax=Wandonia haliotis TaxID=574963 RepID=A0ABN1MLM5_9FLAO
MEINDELIDHIAHLARLEFEGNEKESIKTDLRNIIDFMSKLNEVPTNNVEPLIFMTDELSDLREDVAIQSISQEEALKNAPKKDSDYFRIPKVLDKNQ